MPRWQPFIRTSAIAVQLLNEIGVSNSRLFRRAAASKDVGLFLPSRTRSRAGEARSGCEAQGWKFLGSLLFGPLESTASNYLPAKPHKIGFMSAARLETHKPR